jgi:hypothetical protein
MRTYLLGFLLSPILLLAQTPINHIGEVTVASLDVTSESVVSSEHLSQITQEFESHSLNPSQLREMAERTRYGLQREGYMKSSRSLSEGDDQAGLPTQWRFHDTYVPGCHMYPLPVTSE